MDPLVERVAQNVRRRALPRPRERFLVAVSGGVDSMVLLAVLHVLSARFHWRLEVAHFNHRLRGRASDADERLVRKCAEQLGWPFWAGAGDVRREAARRGISIEMAARELRHGFLASIARRRRMGVIALAHHADDQAELVLLRLLRGASTEGLGGMRWRAPSAFGNGIMLVRPLLDAPKSELLAFAKRLRLAFREDATNASLDPLRNRIRRDLLPRLERKYQPGVRAVLARVAQTLSDDGEFIGAVAARWRGARTPNFETLPRAVQRRVLAEELIAAGLSPDFDLMERLRESPGKPISAPDGRQVTRDDRGRVRVGTPIQAGFSGNQMSVSLTGLRGHAEFAGIEFSWAKFKSGGRVARHRPSLPSAAGVEWFDADRLGGRILLRHWQPGDRFQPIGMARPVKLQDLFCNAKVPAAERRRRVVAEAESGAIFWVEGLRMGERFKLDSHTRRRLKWCWQRASSAAVAAGGAT